MQTPKDLHTPGGPLSSPYPPPHTPPRHKSRSRLGTRHALRARSNPPRPDSTFQNHFRFLLKSLTGFPRIRDRNHAFFVLQASPFFFFNICFQKSVTDRPTRKIIKSPVECSNAITCYLNTLDSWRPLTANF